MCDLILLFLEQDLEGGGGGDVGLGGKEGIDGTGGIRAFEAQLGHRSDQVCTQRMLGLGFRFGFASGKRQDR